MNEDYKVGDIIMGQVTGIEKYGIFVSIDPFYDGLVHISEVSSDYVKDIHEFVSIGETIYCQVLEVDNDNLHLKLSIKNINYKSDDSNNPIKETRKGFLPLKENLDIWINEKLDIYKGGKVMYYYDFSNEKVIYENINSIVEVDNKTINCSVLVTDKNILLFDNVMKNSVLSARCVQIQPEYKLLLAIKLNNLKYKVEGNDTIITDKNIILYNINLSKIKNP